MKPVWDWLNITEQEVNARAKSETNCIVEGCNRPFHLGYCLCKQHFQEFRTSDDSTPTARNEQ